MKQKNGIAYLHLLGLPEGLPFVLFCSLLGSLITKAPQFFTIGLSFSANLAIYCLAQSYKHISNAPQDAFSPSGNDPNPISLGLVSLRTARISFYFALLTSITSAFLLGRINITLTFSAVLLTLALFHPNIHLSSRLMLGLNQHHFLYGGIFLLNSIFSNRTYPTTFEITFPLLFVTSVYLMFRMEELRSSIPQHQNATFWRILFISILLISTVVTFMTLKPVPIWIIALWVLLAAVQLSVGYTHQPESNSHDHLYLFRVFENAGVVSFLVYLIFIFINIYKS